MAHTLQVRYGQLIDDYLRKNLWIDQIANTKYEGDPKAGTVKIPQRTEATVAAYNKASGLSASTSTTSYVDLSINKDYAVNEIVDGYDAAAVPDNIQADRLESAAYGLKKQEESDFFAALVAGGTESSTTTTVAAANVTSLFLAEMTAHDAADVPQEDRWVLVTSAIHAIMLQDASFIKASEIGQDMLVKGQIGEYYGYRVFKSTNLPAQTAGTNTLEWIIGHSQNAHFVEEWMVNPNWFDLNGSAAFVGAAALKGRKVYGSKVSRATSIRIKGHA